MLTKLRDAIIGLAWVTTGALAQDGTRLVVAAPPALCEQQADQPAVGASAEPAPSQRRASADDPRDAIEEGAHAPILDGKLDDPVWAAAEVTADFRQFEPSPGACGSERTEARVVTDGQAIYVAMRMHDSHANLIRSQLLRRDDGGPSGDWAAVILDSYDDHRTAYRFAATPRGTTSPTGSCFSRASRSRSDSPSTNGMT